MVQSFQALHCLVSLPREMPGSTIWIHTGVYAVYWGWEAGAEQYGRTVTQDTER